jgi:hypothetical protein
VYWKQAVRLFKVKNLGVKLKREQFAPLVDSVLQQLKPDHSPMDSDVVELSI